MIRLNATSPELMPMYMSSASAGADVKSKKYVMILPGETKVVLTGVFIEEWRYLKNNSIPFLDMRLRSSLSLKGLSIPNGVGTIDADYGNEIGLIVHNHSKEAVIIKEETRIGQLVLNYTQDIEGVERLTTKRKGGYGSTNQTVFVPGSKL
jgi:dUTP pyrophosphatase